jgi:endonuclease/exonuclease/phosphatase family metal-dependent hydrolase
VIDAVKPDIAGLQELDAEQERSRGLDQTRFLAERLGMAFFYVAARRCGTGHFGNALLCRLPCESIRYACIPQLHASSEPRAAQWIAVDGPWGRFHIVNTHLGLRPQEQLIQARSLLGGDWLGHPDMGQHAILCGDLNARPGSPAYIALKERLRDAQLTDGRRPRATFPALLPLVRIDHVFLSSSLGAERVEVPAGLARIASDHRPLVVDVKPHAESLS